MSDRDLQALVERYHAAPTPLAREAAVLAGIPLVRSILGKVTVPDHPLAGLDDLEGAALVGLVEALDGYDVSRGVQFVTFAYLRVRGAVVDYLRTLDVLSLDKRRRVGEAAAAAEALRQELGAEPADRDVAARIGVSLADYDALMAEAQTRFALSLDAPRSDDEDGTLHDAVADDAGGAGFEAAEDAHTLATVRTAVAALPERTRAMIGMYYDEGLTLREVGEVFGVSEARVSQILGKTLLRLRACLEAEVSA